SGCRRTKDTTQYRISDRLTNASTRANSFNRLEAFLETLREFSFLVATRRRNRHSGLDSNYSNHSQPAPSNHSLSRRTFAALGCGGRGRRARSAGSASSHDSSRRAAAQQGRPYDSETN